MFHVSGCMFSKTSRMRWAHTCCQLCSATQLAGHPLQLSRTLFLYACPHLQASHHCKIHKQLSDKAQGHTEVLRAVIFDTSGDQQTLYEMGDNGLHWQVHLEQTVRDSCTFGYRKDQIFKWISSAWLLFSSNKSLLKKASAPKLQSFLSSNLSSNIRASVNSDTSWS